MKTATWIVAAIAACLASYVDADGVCYDPDHTGKSESSVRADMATIKSKGFSHVRTYISKFGNTDMAAIVASSGLRVVLGVPYPDGDYQQHINNAINAAKTGNVDMIMVGNENLAGLGYVPQTMLDAIYQIKSAGVKVGTVQRTAELRSSFNGMAGLVSACDFVGVNIHPFFTPNEKPEKAISNTKAQWDSVINSGLPGIGGKLFLGETGWPTSGNYAGSQGSVAGAQSYWNAYKSWSSFLPDSKKFYFQFFDTPYKGPEYERTFGLFGADASNKISAGGNPVPTPAPTPVPTTPAPTTPAPTTPEPTTAEPTQNATTSTSGSESAAGEAASGSGLLDAGVGSASASVAGDSTATNEEAVTDLTSAPTEEAPATETGAEETGGNDNGGAVTANTQSAPADSTVGIVVVAMFGVAAVGAAFAFIYKARQKAAELEASESKSFDSLSMTPGGGCVL